MGLRIAKASPGESRLIRLAEGCCKVPERLLLSHGRGKTLFITGAGSSIPSGLPNFKGLTLKVYERLDPSVHALLIRIPDDASNQWPLPTSDLRPDQLAEVKRFIAGDFDVSLGMLERRMDFASAPTTTVRTAIKDELDGGDLKPSDLHKALVKLSDRGTTSTLITTNFDRLLELASRQLKKRMETYSLASMPRPGYSSEFGGVLHIHGVIAADSTRHGYCVITDQDFGEFYLRRQVVPEFIYDAARLFNLVLVGYSANDPPMRYLLNAVAADGLRFSDVKDRYAFIEMEDEIDPTEIADWIGRGIQPIPYSRANNHAQLTRTLEAWALYSQHNGNVNYVERKLRALVKLKREAATDEQRDMFDFLFRRESDSEREKLIRVISGAEISWIDAALAVAREPRTEG